MCETLCEFGAAVAVEPQEASMDDEVIDEQAEPIRAAPWEQQPDESLKQFDLFTRYRDLPTRERSLALVGRQWGVSTSYLERLSAQLEWVRRVTAFDQEQDRIRQASRVRRIREAHDRQAEVAATIMRKVAERLEMIDITSIKPSDVARLLEVASRVERAALGILPDDVPIHQPSVINADEIRAMLKSEGLLSVQRHRSVTE